MLTYVESNETYSTYRDHDDNVVYLKNGSFQRLIPPEDLDLTESWTEWLVDHPSHDTQGWLDHLSETLTVPYYIHNIHFCDDCSKPGFADDMCSTYNGVVCEPCHNENYQACDRCDYSFRSANLHSVQGGDDVCDRCIENYYTWCENCEVWYREGYDDDHTHGRNCDPMQTTFTIRNDGQPPLGNDEGTTITLPSGLISEEGMSEVSRVIWASFRHSDEYYNGDDATRTAMRIVASFDHLNKNVGDKWQTTRGNFTKRLSRWAFTDHKLKLSPALISDVGNIASAHSRAVEFDIEVTRDLNLSPEEFGNEGSCWWGGYASSRCALKTHGGFGLRAFDNYHDVIGRAWVMPVKKKDGNVDLRYLLTPTFETMTPDGFIVFNGYGALEGYAPARIMAHMAGMTYRKITFQASPMYINSEAGYLVAPEELASKFTDSVVYMTLETHSNLLALEQAHREEMTHVA